MNSNKKLTKLIAERTITKVETLDNNTLEITLDDNSKMSIKTNGQVNVADLQGLNIAKIQQENTTLRFVNQDSKTVDISLSEAASSVFLRDKTGAFAYSD